MGESVSKNKKFIDVGVNDWAFSTPESGETLKTNGAHTCIVVAVRAPEAVYLGHFSDPRNLIQRGSLEPKIRTFHNMLGHMAVKVDPKIATIWIGGGSPATDHVLHGDQNPTVLAEMTFDNFVYVGKKLIEFGYPEGNIEQFMSGYDERINVEVNPSSGLVGVDAYSVFSKEVFTRPSQNQ